MHYKRDDPAHPKLYSVMDETDPLTECLPSQNRKSLCVEASVGPPYSYGNVYNFSDNSLLHILNLINLIKDRDLG